MARQCKSTEEKHRFVLTLPLHYEKWQRDRMDTIFKVGNAMKNNLIAFEKRQLHNFVRRKDYRELQKVLAAAYKAKDEERIAKLCEQRSSLIAGAGFTAYAFEKRINKYRLHYKSKGKPVVLFLVMWHRNLPPLSGICLKISSMEAAGRFPFPNGQSLQLSLERMPVQVSFTIKVIAIFA